MSPYPQGAISEEKREEERGELDTLQRDIICLKEEKTTQCKNLRALTNISGKLFCWAIHEQFASIFQLVRIALVIKEAKILHPITSVGTFCHVTADRKERQVCAMQNPLL